MRLGVIDLRDVRIDSSVSIRICLKSLLTSLHERYTESWTHFSLYLNLSASIQVAFGHRLVNTIKIYDHTCPSALFSAGLANKNEKAEGDLTNG